MNDRTHRSVIVDPAPEDTEGLSDLPDADTARRVAEAQNNPASRQTQEPQGDERPDWIPEKFWDGDIERSAKKMADSYTSLESDRGRLANEVGTLRHLVDEALDLKRTQDLQNNGGNAADEDSQPVTADDLFNDPEGTLTRVVEKATRPLAERYAQSEKEKELQRFQEAHPTFEKDLQDEQFLAWVGQSPYRKRLAQKVMESEKQGDPDFEAADELWSGWEEVREAPPSEGEGEQEQAVNQQGQTRQQAPDVSQATVVSRGGAESDVDHRPVYSRAALVKKRMQDPDAYYDPEFQKIIQQAYADGRVR